MTEWIPAGLTPGTVGERVFAATDAAEAREAVGAAAADDPRLEGAAQAGANLTDLTDPAAALAALGAVKGVGLFVRLGEESVAEGTDVILTAGHSRPGQGAARYVLDPDQADPTETAWRRKTANGRWFTLDEAEPTFEQFGARGQDDHLSPRVDDSEAVVDGAVAWSNLTGRAVRASGRVYNVRRTIELTYGRLKGVGSTNSGNGAAATSCLLFSHLGAAPGVRTTLGGNKKLAVIEGFDLRAASWDPIEGCTGYGLDVASRVIARDLSVQHWGKSALFLHGDGQFGGTPSGGPYHSRFESCRFLYAREHGAVVGTGANAVTFVDCEWKWNGAPVYGAPPSAAGGYDGLHVNHEGDGNPGDAYAAYWPEALTVLGGDASYNSRYGFNFLAVRNSGAICPAYAELNRAADGQVNLGLNVDHCHMAFGAVSGGAGSVRLGVYGEYTRNNDIRVGGRFLGGGTDGGSRIGYTFRDTGLMLAESADRSNQVFTAPVSAATGRADWRLDGPLARFRIGSNLAEHLEVSSAVGVKLPSRGRSIKFLDHVPLLNRGSVLSATEVDSTAWLQAAIDTGKDVDLEGLTIYAAGLSMANNQQCLFSSGGVANVFKNSDGPILSVIGSDVTIRHVVFRGRAAAFNGNNVELFGNRPRLEFCGSLDAHGRAVFAPADKVQILGYVYGYQTADASAEGYDIEIGHTSAATLYHQIIGTYGGANGGILLVNPGSHAITDCLFSKLTIQKSGSFPGANGGKMSGNRILGDVSVALSNAIFVANHFGAITVRLEPGTGGCSIDESNTWQGGAAVINRGNGSSNFVARSIGTGARPYDGPGHRYGAAADAVELVYRGGEGVWSNWNLLLNNGKGLKVRNHADTADMTLITMFQTSDSVFVGHGQGPGNTVIDSGAAGVRLSSSNIGFLDCVPSSVKPSADNTTDLGAVALRFKTAYSYVVDAKTEFRVNGTKVLGVRDAGWVAATGTANKAAWNADSVTSLSFSPTPTQAECVAFRDACAAAHRRQKAIEDALRTHGLIS